jgi:rfaE bifunctional protein kinase chain/domain
MDQVRLRDILKSIKDAKIGVIGDFCLDAYWLLDDSPPQKSIETGRPTRAVLRQRYGLGGAGNVINNLVELGVGSVSAFGVVSNDVFGREMLMQLEKRLVDTSGLIFQSSAWDTPVYAKPYLGVEEQERIDFGRFNQISGETEERLIASLSNVIERLDVLIVNQQLPSGIYSPRMVQTLNEYAIGDLQTIFVLDSRNRSEEFRSMVCKMNACEAARVCGELKESNEFIPIDDLKRYAQVIYQRSKKAIFVTRSGRGVLLFDGTSFSEIPGIQVLKKIDPVGAGDTTVSAIAAALASACSLEEAGSFANYASAVTVQKLQQTGTASPPEILEVAATADYVYRPELADDTRRSRYYQTSEIEIVNPEVMLGLVKYAIFDHDGTISSLRQGWENIMEPVMMHSIFGLNYDSAGEEAYHRVLRRVKEYIDKSTGIETIQQMQALADMVREFGFVPEDQILEAKGYKDVYNTSLMERVELRLAKLVRGELEVSDYTIKGVILFLKQLRQHGIELYLASGTDTEDVVREAEVLGYAGLFEGRIYGSTGEVSKSTKRIVIETIIRENKLQGPELVCFGDGPVEIRESKRYGGTAVGVASDEVRRYGLNSTKRSRLIKAGADLVVPDFSQYELILRVLLGKENLANPL